MSARIACPACRSTVDVSAEAAQAAAAASFEIRCPQCGQRIVLGNSRTAVTTEPLRTANFPYPDPNYDEAASDRRRRRRLEDSDLDVSLEGADKYWPSAHLALLVRNAIWANIVASSTTIVFGVWVVKLAHDELNGVPVPLDRSLPANIGLWLISVIEFLCLVVGAVCFLMWFHRVYANLPVLGARRLTQSPGWAVGNWFLPPFFLFRPREATQEMWQNSDPDPRRGGPGEPKSWLIEAWWGLWVAANVLSFTAGVFSWNLIGDAGQRELFGLVGVLVEVLTVIDAGLVLMVVARIEARMEARAAALESEGGLPDRDAEDDWSENA
ncbi:MAG TPA: DUF4328 domain-containing protein [Gemmataceae bacterium]|jgi:DNA-directed RNA polymerase subunit RPC12/RpoP|nr:DUF4328 domain-containing protein [Gemmataceae bacterium]